MRIRLIFNVKNPGGTIPFNHQHILSSIFRNLIVNSDTSKVQANYNFSAIKGKFKVVNTGIQLLSLKATIVFSSTSEEFIKYFIEALMKEKFINVGSVFLEFDKVEKEEKVEFNNMEYKYVCISPIVLINPIDYQNGDPLRFISPTSDEFSDFLYESTLNRLEAMNIVSEEEMDSLNKFQIIPDKIFLNNIQNNNKKFSRVFEARIDHQKIDIRGYTFPFTLYASEIIHNFIFTNGLGELCNNGLGMLDLAESNYSHRTLPMSFRKRENVSTDN